MNTSRILLFFSFLLLLSACGDKNKMKVSGKITNGADKVLYLKQLELNGEIDIDSVVLKEKGNFKFTLPKLENPTFFLLKLSDKNFITLLADSTEQIEVIADAKNLSKDYTVNSLGSNYIQVLNTRFDRTKTVVDSLMIVYNETPKEDKEGIEEVRQTMIEAIENQKSFIQDFVMANPRSFASYYAVFQRFDDGTLVLNAYDKEDLNLFSTVATSLSLFYPESPRSEQLKNFVLGVRKEMRLEELQAKLKTEVKSGIPDIEVEDISGKKIKLSSLKGKIVLLSFWASWDEKSRKENKNLLNTYKKYKAKGFEVYQVSLDRSKILWEGAVEQDKLPWISVSDLRFTDSYPARIYNVQRLPANYLISKEGEVIGKDLFGRILDEKLNDLLN